MGKNLLRKVTQFADENQAQILTGMGLAGFFSAGVFVGMGTIKAVRLIDEKKEKLQVDKLTKKETLKTVYPCYIPAVVTAGLSTACILVATKVNLRRTTALATAYSLSEKAFSEYKREVVERVGEQKEREIAESVDKRHLERSASPNSDLILVGDSEILCYDNLTGRYFKSTQNDIQKAVNHINALLIDENTATLNEFYSDLNIPTVKIGDELGWDIERNKLSVRFSTQLTRDGKPCLVITYKTVPLYGY